MNRTHRRKLWLRESGIPNPGRKHGGFNKMLSSSQKITGYVENKHGHMVAVYGLPEAQEDMDTSGLSDNSSMVLDGKA